MAISEANSLGAQSVIIIGGGEPTIYKHYKELVKYIADRSMIPVTITNGTTMDKDLAKFLLDNNASISIKRDSFVHSIQDQLVGRKGWSIQQLKGICTLMEVFGQQDAIRSRIALSFVITALNYTEIENIWRFCRTSHVVPNPNIFNVKGRGASQADMLALSKADIDSLLQRLEYIDVHEFELTPKSLDAIEHPCLQHMYSVYIDVDGYVHPCPAVNLQTYNCFSESLASIINSDTFINVRNTRHHLGPSDAVAMIRQV